MKQTYILPAIKVKNITENFDLLQSSADYTIKVNGSEQITTSDQVGAKLKHYSVWETEDDQQGYE